MKNYYFLFSFRPKSVPNSPSIPRAFSNLRHQLTSAWSGSGKKKQSGGASANQALSSDDKKKWQSSQDCASKSLSRNKKVVLDEIDLMKCFKICHIIFLKCGKKYVVYYICIM